MSFVPRNPAQIGYRRIGAVLLCLGLSVGIAFAEEPPAADGGTRYQIDKDRRMFAGIKDDERILSEAENLDEFLAYNEVFEFANQFSAAELEANGRRDVSYRDLMSTSRDEFKLDLITFEGKLWGLSKRTPTPTLESAGVAAIYIGWLYPANESGPVCVLFSELPAGITPATVLEPPPTVRFAGYAFKVIRYEAPGDSKQADRRSIMRRAPLLIGKSVTVVPTPVFTPGENWQGTFVPLLLTGLGVLSAVGFGLAWWYRRGDRVVRTVMATRTQQNPFSVG